MKVKITEDEWYPVFDVDENINKQWGYLCELDDALIARHRKALEEFQAVQDLLNHAIFTQHGNYQ